MPAHPIPIEVKSRGLVLLAPPYSYSLRRVAKDLDVSHAVVHTWRKELIEIGSLPVQSIKSPDTYSAEQKFSYVLQCADMDENELSAFCREQGLFVEQVKAWIATSLAAHASKPSSKVMLDKQQRGDKKRIRQLEKELARKDKALAETAALLVLREKFNALWEVNEDE